MTALTVNGKAYPFPLYWDSGWWMVCALHWVFYFQLYFHFQFISGFSARMHDLNLWSNWEQFAQQNKHFSRNWKVLDDRKIRDCVSLSEVSHLTNSCEAVFHALVGEIFLPFAWIACGDSEKEKMFISRRVYKTGDNHLAEDFICTGCQLCGSPLDSDYKYGRLSLGIVAMALRTITEFLAHSIAASPCFRKMPFHCIAPKVQITFMQWAWYTGPLWYGFVPLFTLFSCLIGIIEVTTILYLVGSCIFTTVLQDIQYKDFNFSIGCSWYLIILHGKKKNHLRGSSDSLPPIMKWKNHAS